MGLSGYVVGVGFWGIVWGLYRLAVEGWRLIHLTGHAQFAGFLHIAAVAAGFWTLKFFIQELEEKHAKEEDDD